MNTQHKSQSNIRSSSVKTVLHYHYEGRISDNFELDFVETYTAK